MSRRPARAPPRSSCATSTSPTACAASTARCCAASQPSRSSRARSYGLVGESGCGKSTAALAVVRYLPRNGTVSGGLDRRRRPATCWRMVGRRAAPTLRAERRLDGLPGSRQGAQPVDPRRPPGRRGVRGRRRVQGRGRANGRRRCCAKVQIADPDQRDAALPAPAVGRHAAARRDRDGARHRSDAADPRRADHRPRRDGRGRGARPGRARCAAEFGPRCCSSATTSA